MERKNGITTQMFQTLYNKDGEPNVQVTLTKHQRADNVEISIELLGEAEPLKFRLSFASLRDFIKSTQKIHIRN